MVAQLFKLLLAVGIGAAGGMAFSLIGTPLPFMLGAMTATTIASFCKLPLAMPKLARNCLATVLGVMFGSVLDVSGIPTGSALVVLALLVVLYLASMVGLGWLFFRRAGFDSVTSYFAAVPGNLSEIVVLAEDCGADVKKVVLVHSARLAVTVTAISLSLRYLLGLEVVALTPKAGLPPGWLDLAILVGCAIVGSLAGKLLRIPAPFLIGPLIASVIVHAIPLTQSAPPAAMVAGAQVVLGTFIGVRFAGVRLNEVFGTLAISLIWALSALLFVAAFAAGVSYLLGEAFDAMLLAFSPGGVAEVSALAVAAHISLGFVTTIQIIRMSCLVVIGPIVVRRLFGSKVTH